MTITDLVQYILLSILLHPIHLLKFPFLIVKKGKGGAGTGYVRVGTAVYPSSFFPLLLTCPCSSLYLAT